MKRDKLDGILVVDKPSGPTSHDIVARLRRLLGMRRIGHCGTLDPMATGILVVCLGRFTRLNQWLSAGAKEYEATFTLGAVSDTEDGEGKIEAVAGARAPSLAEVEARIEGFVGRIDQVPPAYSAVKVNGVRSYALARQERAVALKARVVEVAAFEVLAYRYPKLQARVVCSRGTYIRSLGRDLGAKLGCGAYMSALRRTRVGPMGLADAHTLEALEARVGAVEQALIAPRRALAELPHLDLDRAQTTVFGHGGTVSVNGGFSGECAVWGKDQTLCGIGRFDQGTGHLRPLKVLANAPN